LNLRHTIFAFALVSAFVLVIGAAIVAAQESSAAQAFDVLIKNGKVLDGTGGPWYSADIGVRGDHIAAIGKLEGASAKKTIDAAGRIVAPGFIDTLGQSEMALLFADKGYRVNRLPQ
jgi:N-acyl-D-amino-acid deacylase